MPENKTYSVKITESSKELNALERVAYKNTSDAIKLDEIVKDEPFTVTIVDYAVLGIHNDKVKNGDKDYEQYLLISDTGDKYITGSPSFWTQFRDIYDELSADGIKEIPLKIFKLDSKNYSGKKFLTCGIGA